MFLSIQLTLDTIYQHLMMIAQTVGYEEKKLKNLT